MEDPRIEDERPELGRTYGLWVLFGVFGIGVAVGIALLAGSFASQPVGLTGNPVSAGAALKPAVGKKSRPEPKKTARDPRTGNKDGVARGVPAGPAGSTAASVSGATTSSSSGGGGNSTPVSASGPGGGSGTSQGSSGSSSGSGGSGSGGSSGYDDSDSDSGDDYGDDSEDDYEDEDDDD